MHTPVSVTNCSQQVKLNIQFVTVLVVPVWYSGSGGAATHNHLQGGTLRKPAKASAADRHGPGHPAQAVHTAKHNTQQLCCPLDHDPPQACPEASPTRSSGKRVDNGTLLRRPP